MSSAFQLKHCYIFGIHFYPKSKKKKKFKKIASNFNVFQQIFGIANNKIMATYMKKNNIKGDYWGKRVGNFCKDILCCSLQTKFKVAYGKLFLFHYGKLKFHDFSKSTIHHGYNFTL